MLLVCFAFAPFASISAQEAARSVTLEQARELALQHNKDIAPNLTKFITLLESIGSYGNQVRHVTDTCEYVTFFKRALSNRCQFGHVTNTSECIAT